MKRIISAVITGVALLFLVQVTQFTPVSQIEYDGRIAGSSAFETSLTDTEQVVSTIELEDVSAFDGIYEQMGSYYVGEDRRPVNISYPMYFNDNTGIIFLSDEGNLFDENFDIYTVREKYMVSDGTLYDQFQRGQGEEVYLFFAAKSGLFVNTKPMTVTTEQRTIEIPMNSIVNLEENMIRYYFPNGEELNYRAVGDVDANAAITMNGKDYMYRDLLISLGVMQEEKPVSLKEEEPEQKDKKEDKKKEQAAPDQKQEKTGEKNPADTDDSANSNDSKEGEAADGGTVDPGYVAPQVTPSGYTSTVYSVSSHIDISDPQGKLYKNRVELQIWNQGKIFMRKYLRRTQDYTINGLQPGQSYTMVVTYKYENAKGETVEKTFDEVKIKTKEFSSLHPIRFSFDNGHIYAKRLQILNWKLLSDAADEAVQNISKLVIEVNGKQYGLRSSLIQRLRDGETIEFQTDDSLPSNMDDITYTVRAYDSFGNELTCEDNEKTTRTCKQTPTVKLKTVSNKVSDVKFSIELNNPDDIDIENYRLLAADGEGNTILTKNLTEDDNSLSFNDLDAGKTLRITITGDYDVEDGAGMLTDQVLADTQIVTVPLSNLGRFYMVTSAKELYSDKAVISYRLETRTNTMLVSLLQEMTVYAKSGDTVKSVTLTEEQLASFKNGETVDITYEGLNSRTTYALGADTVVHHGTTDYTDFTSVLSMKEFKSLRRSAWIERRNTVMKEDSISFEVRALDPDEAVPDGYVGMRVMREDETIVDAIKIDTVQREDTDDGWVRYTYTINEEQYRTRPYTFQFYAVEYNEAYTAATRETNKIIEQFTESTPATISGKVGISALSAGAQKDYRRVDMTYSIYDRMNYIKYKEYTFIIYQNDEEYARYTYTMTGTYYTHNERPIAFDVPNNADYRIELWVINTGLTPEEAQMLGSVTFDTFYDVIPIRTIEDLYQVKDNPDGHYLVLNDLDITADPQCIDTTFTGQIDFAGHTVKTQVTDDWRYLFQTNKGVLMGAVVDTSYANTVKIDSGEDGSDRASGFVLTNSGTISDVQLEFRGTTELANDGIAGLVHTNAADGVLENFVLHAASAMHTKRDASYGVAENEGTIRNGYAYGESINASYPNTVVRELDWEGKVVNNADYRKRVGGIAGYNAPSGKISNVYSLVNVKMSGNLQLGVDEIDEVSVGNVLGLNYGTISNAYSYGEEMYQDGALAYGPTVGNNLDGAVTNNNVYYISDSGHSNTKLNKRVTKLQLYDEDFQNTALNSGASSGQFDTGTYPALGYYPHVKQSVYMPEQPLLPLPVVDTSEAVDIKSIEVLDYTDDTATVKLVLNNPGSGDVQAVSVKDIGVTRVVSFTHERKQTVVTIELRNPAKYYSVYSIASVRIKNNYGGGSITRNYSEGAQEIFVDFFRPVETELDWSEYVIKNPKENYKLTKDLDFSGFNGNQMYMDSYYGKLDGRGHSISNVNINNSSSIALIKYLRGSNSGIYNLTVNHMTGNVLKALVYSVVSGTNAEFDHVFINDIKLKGSNEDKGALLAVVSGNITVTNCGVNGVTIPLNSSGHTRTGGMFGRINQLAEIRNCYVVNLNMTTSDRYPYGAGGFVGEAVGSGVIEDCYVSGQITGVGTYVGGFASEISNSYTVSRCYADVDIRLNPVFKTQYAAGGFYYDGTIQAAKLQNLYTQGNLYNEYSGGTMRRLRGTSVQTYTTRQIYAAEKQLINGQMVSDNNEKLSGILSYEELAAPGTLETTVGLGGAYDYSQIEDGILPKLKDTDGVLLPGQEDLYIAGRGDADSLQIENVELSEKTDIGVIMTIYVNHPKGYTVSGAEVPDLTQEEVVTIPQGDTGTAVRIKLKPEKYFDSYTVTKVSGKNSAGEDISTDAEWKVACQFYKNIASYDDWQTISNDYENYRLTADIDFAGKGSYMRRNFKVNRFEGVTKADGTYPVLKNIILELNGNNIKANTANVFDTVRESFRRVRLENYSVSISNPSRYTTSVGFIRYTTGYIEYVDIEGMRLCAPTDGTTPTGPYYAQTVGFISTGYNWSVPVIRYVHTKDTVVCAKNRAGTIIGTMLPAVNDCYVEDASVYGGSYLGAVAGNSGTATRCVVVDSKVKGTDEQIGGVGGAINGYNCRVENVEISGSYYVGGITGNIGTVRSNYVSGSTITAKSAAGGIIGRDDGSSRTDSNNYVYDCTIGASDGAAGGIYGTNNTNSAGNVVIASDTDVLQHNGVAMCTITGKVAGGIAGEMYGSAYDCFVRGSSVTGTQYAGGVVGRYYGNYVRYVTNNLIDADITATEGSAGGVIGCFDNLKNAAGKNQLEVAGNILAGGIVSGASYAGGLIGETPIDRVLSTDANVTWNINILISGTIRADTHASLQIGNRGGDTETLLPNIKEMRAHSSVQVQESRVGTIPAYESFLVTKDELMTPSFYTSRGYKEGKMTGMASNTSYWGITGYADQGYVPITWMGNYFNTVAGTTLSGIVINDVNYEEKAAGINNGVTVKGRDLQDSRGKIPIPEDVSMMMFAMRRMSLDDTEEIPELTVYPSDVDKLNLEFSHTGNSLAFFIGDDDSVLYPIDSRTKTLYYDFSEPLKITITNYMEDKEITVLPAGYTRKVMVYQDEYYYITASGVQDSEGEISGDFVHLYNGKALTRTGKIINVVTGAFEGNVNGAGLMDETVPLQTFAYGDAQVETYGCYSVVDGTQEREMQIFLKNQELATVDGSLNNVKDSVLIDTYQEEEYQVVLGTDGMLYQLKDEIQMPENFDNSGIKYMASNLDASGHWLLVEYENGGVAGFDYVTGEMLFEDLVESDMNLLEFAESFLSLRASILSDEMPEVYGTLEVLRDQLSEEPIENILAKMGDTDQQAELSLGTVEADGTDVTMPSADETGTDQVQQNEASAHAFEQYGTQYIPFYDSEQSEYVLYSSDELLDADRESVRSENSKIATVPALASYYAAPSTYIHIRRNIQGIIFLGGLLVVIGAGVVFLMLKRRRMR